MAKILVVEDDAELAEIIADQLSGDLHTVEVVNDGKDGYDRLRHYAYNVAVLDWNLPKMTGVEICRGYRAGGGSIPILMLTGKDTITDKTTGLDAGADDYLTKPFHLDELSARVRALLRRMPAVVDPIIKISDLTLDLNSHKVARGDREISLQPREYALLEFLMQHPNEIFSQDALMERVWKSDSETSPETVRVHIAKLRSKIDEDGKPQLIKTVHRVGYVLEVPR